LLGKTFKGLGLGFAVLTMVEALSLLKQHLDLKREAKSFYSSLNTVC